MPRSKATSTPDRRRSHSPVFRFVGGKGGVGKTTCAAAIGLAAARPGRPTLVVSTDPAPSLGDALRQRLSAVPRAVRGMPGLFAVEVDAAAALDAWITERRALLEEIALRGTWLDRDDVTQLLRLSLPGIDEIAGLLRIGDFADSGRYAYIVVDTAPTGHLLRMLAMPAVLERLAEVFDRMQAKHRIMVDALRGGWTPDSADALIRDLDAQARGLGALLRDPTRSRLSWVTLAETMAIEETGDALRALSDQHILVDQIIVNRLTPPPRGPCPWCRGRRSVEQDAIRRLRPHLRRDRIQVARIPAAAVEPRGPTALCALARHLGRRVPRNDLAAGVVRPPSLTAPIAGAATPVGVSAVVPPDVALVLFGGKGGVGKTTCAAAAAIDAALARRDRRVLLLSADPAHSLGDVLGQTFTDDPRRIRGGPANLTVRELDAARGFAALRERFAQGIEDLFLRTGGSGAGSRIAGQDRQVLADVLDLAPPGVDELVTIIEVLDTLADSRRGSPRELIVLDTAPTGHALRLLEMPALVHDWVKALMAILLKYQPVIGVGDLAAVLVQLSQGLGRLRTLLTDSTRTRFIVVTRAAALPRAETVRLLGRLRAAGIGVPTVIVNAAGAGSCSRCRGDRARQMQEVAALARDIRPKRREPLSFVLAPATVPPPAGWRELHAFFGHWRAVPGPARR